MNDVLDIRIKKGVDSVLDLIGTQADTIENGNDTLMGRTNEIGENVQTIYAKTAKEETLTEIKGMISELQESSSSGSTVELTDAEKVLIAGNGYNTYSVGNVLSLHWGGTLVNFVVAHKGYKTSGKIVLVSQEVMNTEPIVWAAGYNNYSSSYLRGFLNTTILNGFLPEVQAAIVNTPVACHNNTTAVTCTDKIWALSYAEAGLGTQTYAPAEGSALSYFNSAARRSKGQYYWLRTPYTSDTSYAWRVYAGGTADFYNVTGTYGVVPAFEI